MGSKFRFFFILGVIVPGTSFADCAADLAQIGVSGGAENFNSIESLSFESELLSALAQSSLSKAIESIEKKVSGYQLPKHLSEAVVAEITSHLQRKISTAISEAQMSFVIHQGVALAQENGIDISEDLLRELIAQNKNWKSLVRNLFEPGLEPQEKDIAAYNLSKYLFHAVTDISILSEDQKKNLERFSKDLASHLTKERKEIIKNSTAIVLERVKVERLIIETGLPYLNEMRNKVEGDAKVLSDRYLLSLYSRIQKYVSDGVGDPLARQQIIEQVMKEGTAVLVEKVVEDIAKYGLSEDYSKKNAQQRNRIINYIVRSINLDRFILAREFPSLYALNAEMSGEVLKSFQEMLTPLASALKARAKDFSGQESLSWSDSLEKLDQNAAAIIRRIFSDNGYLEYSKLLDNSEARIHYIVGRLRVNEDFESEFMALNLSPIEEIIFSRAWPELRGLARRLVHLDGESLEEMTGVYSMAASFLAETLGSVESEDELVSLSSKGAKEFIAQARAQGFLSYEYRPEDRVLPVEFENLSKDFTPEEQKTLRVHFTTVAGVMGSRMMWHPNRDANQIRDLRDQMLEAFKNYWSAVVQDLKSETSLSIGEERRKIKDALFSSMRIHKQEQASLPLAYIDLRHSLRANERELFDSVLFRLRYLFLNDVEAVTDDSERRALHVSFDKWFLAKLAEQFPISDSIDLTYSLPRWRYLSTHLAIEIRRDWLDSKSQQKVTEEVADSVRGSIHDLLKDSPSKEKELEILFAGDQVVVPEENSGDAKGSKEGDDLQKKGSIAMQSDRAAEELWTAYFAATSDTEKQGYRERLFEVYGPWLQARVKHLYRKYKGEAYGYEEEEFFSWAFMGFNEEIDRYEVEQGRFTVFAAKRVQGAIFDNLRLLSFSPRLVIDRSKIVKELSNIFFAQNGQMPNDDELRKLVVEHLIHKKNMGQLDAGEEANKILKDGMNPAIMGELNIASQVNDEEDDGSDRAVSRELTSDDRISRKDFWEFILRSFNSREREILDLYYNRGLSLKEVGLRVGLTESAVSYQNRKILRTLRGYLSDLTEAEIFNLLASYSLADLP